MEEEEAEQLTEEEAAAVLLALGPQIDWTRRLQMEIVGHGYIAGALRYYYTTDGHLREPGFCPRFSSGEPWVLAPKYYLTEEETKAACERHHATGQWESKHFHETPFREEQVLEYERNDERKNNPKMHLADCLKRFALCGVSFLVTMVGARTLAKGTVVEGLFFIVGGGVSMLALCCLVASLFFFGLWLCELANHRGTAKNR